MIQIEETPSTIFLRRLAILSPSLVFFLVVLTITRQAGGMARCLGFEILSISITRCGATSITSHSQNSSYLIGILSMDLVPPSLRSQHRWSFTDTAVTDRPLGNVRTANGTLHHTSPFALLPICGLGFASSLLRDSKRSIPHPDPVMCMELCVIGACFFSSL